MASGTILARLSAACSSSSGSVRTIASLLTIVVVTGLTRLLLVHVELDLSSYGLRPLLAASPETNKVPRLSHLIAGQVVAGNIPLVHAKPQRHFVAGTTPSIAPVPTFFPAVEADSLLLLPILPFGPNNQFRAFREALVLARWLERTLVLPPFFKHYTAARTLSEADTVESHEIFDWNSLAALQPVILWPRWRALCGARLDVMFVVVQPKMHSQYARVEELFQLVGIPGNYSTTVPVQEPGHVVGSITRLANASEANRVFTSRKRCAAVLFPYWHVDISAYNVDLAGHLRRTGKLERLAAHFVSTVFRQQPFAVLHWRYNSDWSGTWCHQRVGGPFDASKVKDPRYLSNCRQIVGLNATRVCQAVRNLLQQRGVGHLYLATPVSDFSPFLTAIRTAMPGLKASRELLNVIGERSDALQAAGLSPVNSNFELSLVEQELASVAQVFIGSDMSSWSANVAYERSGLIKHRPTLKEPVIWINHLLH